MLRGQVVTAVSGFADLEHHRPIRVNDEFRLASITKNYVAALALDLDRDGVVELDARVGRWLPSLPDDLGFLRNVSMRQLLSHTTGLAQTFTDDRDRGRLLSKVAVLDRIPAPVCKPRECWNYADGNYVVAGLVLQAATGTTLSKAIRTRFLLPHGLAHTHFIAPAAREPLPSFVLQVDPVTFQPVQPHRLRRQLLPIVLDDAAGGMMASATDLARWADRLFIGHTIERDGVKQMLDTNLMRDLPCPQGCPLPYGLGVFHYTIADHAFVGHDGSSGAIVVTDVRDGLTIAIVTNGGEQDIREFLVRVVHAVDGT